MKEIAFGWLGLSRSEFYDATLVEFFTRLDGWNEIRAADYRDAWERTRQIMYASLLTGHWREPLKGITKVIPMPWDRKEIERKFNKAAILEKFAKEYKIADHLKNELAQNEINGE